jgi:2-keto-4-pentenoate hydratase/2-oxohepta-3-ene-1,7-dioic acid hydratase in catechol pathway
MPTLQYALATVDHQGRAHACIERDGRFSPLAQLDLPDSLAAVFDRWAELGPKVERAAASLGGGWSAADVRVLTPLQYPWKVLCAGANYYDHLKEMGVQDLRKEAQRLFFFFKPPRNALVGPGKTVRYPARTKMFDWEIELAAVIGRKAKDLTLDNALDCVAGYSIGIDLSARDLNQAPDTFYKLDWVAGKAQDTCCPLGPRIVPAALVGNPHDLALDLTVNGETKQSARTSGMIFDIREQLVLLSTIMTLDPGDVLLTGTPAGVGFPKRTFLKPGDRIAATIENIGTLEVEIY